MLRKTLIAASLLIASGSVLANDNYVHGRVITVQPSISVSVGGGHHDNGFRVLYESGGQRYWTHSDYYPRDVIYVPRPVEVQPVYYSDRSYRRDEGYRHGWRDEHHGWRGHDRDHDDYDHDRRRGHGWGHDD